MMYAAAHPGHGIFFLDKSSIIPYKWVMISSILHTAYIAAIFITAVCLVFPQARFPLLLLLCGTMMYFS